MMSPRLKGAENYEDILKNTSVNNAFRLSRSAQSGGNNKMALEVHSMGSFAWSPTDIHTMGTIIGPGH